MKRFYVSKCAGSSAKWWIYEDSGMQSPDEAVMGFRLKREAQAQADEWNREEQDKANRLTVIDVRQVGSHEMRDAPGIHLYQPIKYEFEDALHSAERDGFCTVWCHYDNLSSLQLKRESKQEQVS